MKRRLLLPIVLGAVALGLAAQTQAMSAPKLKGTVGPGFTIHLTMNGKAVKSLKAGTYTFAISDKATIHNFTLEQEKGGKFEKEISGTGFQGTKTVTLTLKAGKWKYYCSVHESQMFGFFTVK